MDEEALLAGIRAEPDDDLVRLAYADWLEERSRADEAELIRVQIELAAMGEREQRVASMLRDNPTYCLLTDRLQRLVLKVSESAEPRLKHLGCAGFDFRRGLIERVTIPAGAFLAQGTKLLRDFPVRSLHLTHAGPHLRAIFESPALAGLYQLILDGGESKWRDFAAIEQAEHLTRLRSLGLNDIRMPMRAARSLAAAPLASLRNLSLVGCYLGRQTFEVMGASSLLSRLEELTLSTGLTVGDFGNQLLPLFQIRELPQLRVLHLSFLSLAPQSCAAIASSEWIGQLSTLEIGQCPLSDAALEALLRASDLSNLRELELGNCGDRGARRLATSKTLTGLERLTLYNAVPNRITDPGVEALARSPNFVRLLELDLERNGMTDRGGRALANSPHLPREAVLNLGDVQLFPEATESLLGRFRGVFPHSLLSSGDAL